MFFLALLAIVVALAMWFLWPVITACQTRRTADHKSERTFRVPGGGADQPFPSILDEGSVTLSLIVPAYNEEERISTMLDESITHLEDMVRGKSGSRFERGFSYEIVVVDDGSRDRTVDVVMGYAEKYGSDRIRVLKLYKNHGKGGAVRKGMLRARGEYILMVDADGATQFSDLDRLLQEMETIESASSSRPTSGGMGPTGSGSGIVVGSRAHMMKNTVTKRKWYRNILMHGFHFFVSSVGGVSNIHDTQCGFKLFTRAAARGVFPGLHIERWAFDVEILYLARQLRIPVKEVAVNWTEIPGSKLDVATAMVQMARDLVAIRLCYDLKLWVLEEAKGLDGDPHGVLRRTDLS